MPTVEAVKVELHVAEALVPPRIQAVKVPVTLV
jgi:hypothetical protein